MVLILKMPMLTNFFTFDIVLVWSVLHWIGNEYLQSIGEMIRICNKFSDNGFCCQRDYRVSYHHKGVVDSLHLNMF